MACAPMHNLAPLVAVAAVFFSLTALADESDTSREALLCLKSHLSSPNGAAAFATWNSTSPDFCSWNGVTCSNQSQSQPRVVVALDIEAQGLAGEIPACIANLSSLARIHLPSNGLSGGITPELGRLAELRYLNLSFNGIGGEIPPGLGTLRRLLSLDLSSNNLHGEIPLLLANASSLRYLSLKNNSLSGSIPAALLNSFTVREIYLRKNNLSGSIPPVTRFNSQITYLDLTGNSLSGSIPPSLGNLSSLTALLAAQNQLKGSIPDFSKLSVLQFLDLSYNGLSGTVHPSVYNLSSISFLGLANNNLKGSLPPDLGNTLRNIQVLMMSTNHFVGEIPGSLANASSMQFLYLADNSLTGLIPSFSLMSDLQVLMLYSNQLEAGDWTFLSSLKNCSKLLKLNFGENNLRGDLPRSVADLPKTLNSLVLQSNYISGTIPLEIRNLSRISLLYLDKNLLTGSIPHTLGQLNNLVVLSLSQNKFSGEIPQSIGNLSQLAELYLSDNQLSGSIPTSLARCQQLLALNLSCNALTGSINGDMFRKLSQLSWLLDLSHNQFTNSIPLELGSLINLASLNISHNKLTGKIPSSLGACVRLESLRVGGNLLEGSIPQSLANIRGTKVLDFSQNNLSGAIPDFFGTFTSLQYLNMSYNNFEGPVPVGGIFADRDKFFVQGNPHLCTNVPMEELNMCYDSSSKRKHKIIIPMLAVLSSFVALSSILGLYFLIINVLRRRWKSNKYTDPSYMELKKITYSDVSRATNNFSAANIVGSGHFGTVYSGRLDAKDTRVAFKVFKLDQCGALDSFMAECKALKNIRHRNLVKVITACSTYDPMGNEFKALVFEYMANGSLQSRLHRKFDRCSDLTLGARINIAADIASALEYLHNQCIPPVVHCDLKPSNVLFNSDDVACVCDFGLAKSLRAYSSGAQSDSKSMVGPRGSIGYIAPEYGMGSKISAEGDVYSYGIILLEMLTGRNPTDEMFTDGFTLRMYVNASVSNIKDVLDPRLTPEIMEQSSNHTLGTHEHKTSIMDVCALQLLKLGLLCSEESPKDRPVIHDIYSEVMSIKEAFFAMSF
ncbi:probable LRR receptor-like serine/threonine-protein kinase At3g47570 [Oryza brachyantha]|uniref:Receptor kinase-like protein Xa21 n=1 Tax=Oryza brachyantha TaxID=4533 RepID=J3N1J9_ORYBR|nr:probable LRR receptor-like serine/threonine-protein kinase At3g47570 [Oryza brachyantha]